MWGAIIAGVVALASAIISSTSSKKQTQQTNAANMELAQYQAKTNEAFIDKQNAYNAPASQMSRYLDAGLNPNLIYSQGNPGNQSQPARYEAPRVDMHFNPLQIPEVIGQYQDFQMKDRQLAQMDAQTQAIKERTRSEMVNRLSTIVGTQRKEFDLGLAKELRKYNVDIRGHEENILHARSQGAYTKDVLMPDIQRRLLGLQEKGMELRNENQAMQNTFQKYEEQFRKMGITNSDNVWVRVLTRMLAESGIMSGWK